MTKLRCSARNCLYNQDQLCARGDITIGGQDASKPNETSCESFQERNASMTNSVGHPSKEINVRCNVCSCDYNDDCKCCADSIGIAGTNACSCGETECASFDCRYK